MTDTEREARLKIAASRVIAAFEDLGKKSKLMDEIMAKAECEIAMINLKEVLGEYL